MMTTYKKEKADDRHANRSAPLMAAAPLVEETGWLIEENVGAGIHWIALAEDEWPRTKVTTRRARMNRDYNVEVTTYRTPVVRVKDANEAIRFARAQDAEAFIKLFDRFMLNPHPTEHIFWGGTDREEEKRVTKPELST